LFGAGVFFFPYYSSLFLDFFLFLLFFQNPPAKLYIGMVRSRCDKEDEAYLNDLREKKGWDPYIFLFFFSFRKWDGFLRVLALYARRGGCQTFSKNSDLECSVKPSVLISVETANAKSELQTYSLTKRLLARFFLHNSWAALGPVSTWMGDRLRTLYATILWSRQKLRLYNLCVQCIDYRCEDGRFPVLASCVTISNPNLLSSSDTGVDPGIRSWKKHLSEWARCQKAIGGIYFTKKWRAETLQTGFEFDNFKSRLKSWIFKGISWLNGSFLGVMIRVFWKKESRPIKWHHCRLLTRQRSSHLWSMVRWERF
jgi:hypothetical protein